MRSTSRCRFWRTSGGIPGRWVVRAAAVVLVASVVVLGVRLQLALVASVLGASLLAVLGVWVEALVRATRGAVAEARPARGLQGRPASVAGRSVALGPVVGPGPAARAPAQALYPVEM